MKKVALVALGAVAGFGIALGVLPEAKGASDMGTYQSLDLFSNAFERVRANYVRPVQDSELVNAAIQGMVTSLDRIRATWMPRPITTCRSPPKVNSAASASK